jgi:hypothetical protein
MPGVFFAPFDERNQDFAAENAGANLGRFPMGHTLVLPDGRTYRFTLNDGTAEVAGNLYQSVASVANHVNVVADVARAIDSVTVSATLGATAAAIDIYAEGIVHVNDNTGEGYALRIASASPAGNAHAAAASSAVLTVNLAGGEQVQVALTTSSDVSFSRNRFHQVLIHDSPPTAGLAGVSPGVAAADRFYWSQVMGEAAVLADGTLLAGLPVQASITTDGSVENAKRRVRTGSTAITAITEDGARLEDQDGTEVGTLASTVYAIGSTTDATYDISGPILVNAPLVGMCIKANATSEYGLIDLTQLGGTGA